MLARLDYHQDLVMRRETKDLLQSIAEIQEQADVIQKARRSREARQKELASALCGEEGATIAQLAELVPGDYRPLLMALVDENNELLVRIHQRSRQNHLLLARTVEMMQRFMSTLFPDEACPLYNGSGAVFGRGLPSRALYEAVG
jgi:hypothetical protein